jgi:hypothetical protein
VAAVLQELNSHCQIYTEKNGKKVSSDSTNGMAAEPEIQPTNVKKA